MITMNNGIHTGWNMWGKIPRQSAIKYITNECNECRNSKDGAHNMLWVWCNDSSHPKFNDDEHFISSKSPLKDPCEKSLAYFECTGIQWSSTTWFFRLAETHKNILFRWDLGNDWFPSNFNYSFVWDFHLYLVRFPVCISCVVE